MNCRWQVKQMSPSMAHSMKKVSGDGQLNWRWAGEGEKKEENRHMASPRLRLLTGETPGGRKKNPNRFRWGRVRRGWSGWRSPPPSGRFALLENRHLRHTSKHTHTESASVFFPSLSGCLACIHFHLIPHSVLSLPVSYIQLSRRKKEKNRQKKKRWPQLISTCILAACLTQHIRSRSQYM